MRQCLKHCWNIPSANGSVPKINIHAGGRSLADIVTKKLMSRVIDVNRNPMKKNGNKWRPCEFTHDRFSILCFNFEDSVWTSDTEGHRKFTKLLALSLDEC